MSKHKVRGLASGEYGCSCGAVWDRDEGDKCPAAIPPSVAEFAVGERSALLARIEELEAQLAQPSAGVVLTERDAMRDIIASAIGGDAYDCIRVWSAWGVGTMSEDDFVSITEQEDRLYEITDACLDEVARLNPCRAPEATTKDSLAVGAAVDCALVPVVIQHDRECRATWHVNCPKLRFGSPMKPTATGWECVVCGAVKAMAATSAKKESE